MTSSTPLVADHPAPLTKQQVFDNAWRWSRTHPRCAGVIDGRSVEGCLYRNADHTNACLIGCSIPDSQYLRSFENECAARMVPLLPSVFGPEVRPEWADNLQSCHDLAHSDHRYLADVTARLTQFAEENDLTIPSDV